MRRICLIVDDDRELPPMIASSLREVFRREWPEEHESIEIDFAYSEREGLAKLRSLRTEDARLVLITDYDLTDGVGSTLIQELDRLQFAHAWSMLQTGTTRSLLRDDPVVVSLRPDRFARKPVSLEEYQSRLRYMRGVWGL